MASYYSVVIVVVYLILSKLTLVKGLKPLITDSPTVLVRGGDIDEEGLRKVHLSLEQLLGILRHKGYTNVSDLEIVVMEENGSISAIPKSDKRPLQPSDLYMSPSPAFIPIPLIMDGHIVHHNLKYLEKDEVWLYDQMKSYSLDRDQLHQVTLGTFNQKGFLEIDTNNPSDHRQGMYNYKPGDEN
ncbi:DUF421 domain-containing protein [Pseudalkalibacillus caeni]|uniref:DUF421 domain-containing protein n=1 Tax=Exobacillus caeni TaxID=2574798 RepID=UPI00148554A8|nr:DUF421 domain-containing protein [Pseudalkalibacillus caeni]